MGIDYENLDDQVRAFMLQELAQDVTDGVLFLSPRLSDRGQELYQGLLREAVHAQNDDWLAQQLQGLGCLKHHETRVSPQGVASYVRMPRDAALMLAEGEFNRLYARGVCLMVLQEGGQYIEVHRGKSIVRGRPASTKLINKLVPAQILLNNLRASQSVETALDIPPSPKLGLTVRRPKST